MTNTLQDTLTLTPLLRVSHDDSGRERSNDEQLTDMETMTSRNGWSLSHHKPYRDVGSASKYATKSRDGFDTLVADLKADRFAADGLFMWEASRGSRRVGEWATLLDLLEDRGKVVAVVQHGRVMDPANARDRKTLMEDAVDAEYEAAKTSARVRRAMLANAEAGLVHTTGRRMFGYSADGMTVDVAEAALIHEAAGRVLAGESTRSIARDWNARGLRTTAGNEWHPTPIRLLLRNPRLAALRVHHGKVVAKGVWPAIVDEATHTRLAAVLASTPRAARGRSPWVLTGFLRCSLCGARLSGNIGSRGGSEPGTRRYVCRKAVGYHGCGKLTIRAIETEDLLGKLIGDVVNDTDKRRKADVDDSAELAELGNIAADRVDLAELKAARQITMATFVDLAAALDRRQSQVEAVLASKVTKPAAFDLVAADKLVGRPWSELTVDEKRVVLNAFVDTTRDPDTGRERGITIRPATHKGSHVFEVGRVSVDWRA